MKGSFLKSNLRQRKKLNFKNKKIKEKFKKHLLAIYLNVLYNSNK